MALPPTVPRVLVAQDEGHSACRLLLPASTSAISVRSLPCPAPPGPAPRVPDGRVAGPDQSTEHEGHAVVGGSGRSSPSPRCMCGDPNACVCLRCLCCGDGKGGCDGLGGVRVMGGQSYGGHDGG